MAQNLQVTARSGLNIRRFPVDTADRLAAMPRGMVVEPLDPLVWNGRWRRIRATFSTNAVVEGYSAVDYLSPVGVSASNTVRVAPVTGNTHAGGSAATNTQPTPSRPVPPPPSRKDLVRRAVPASLVAGLFHHSVADNVERYLPLVLDAMREAELDDWPHIITALGTIKAETAGFDPIAEYESQYNTEPEGRPFGKYDFRTDIGNNAEGDGYKYRGRGFVQLTGKDNYRRYGERLGIDLVNDPDQALQPDIAARILATFMQDQKDRIAQAWASEDWADARKAVNGGRHGLEAFEKTVKAARTIFDWSKPI
ncbi:MAG: glycoside hydrolase family 19 protein [Pseudomonadota bacterium]